MPTTGAPALWRISGCSPSSSQRRSPSQIWRRTRPRRPGIGSRSIAFYCRSRSRRSPSSPRRSPSGSGSCGPRRRKSPLPVLCAGLLVLAGRLSLESWSALSGATLAVAHWLLTLYETDVVIDTSRQLLGVGDFQVLILKECSGYEGIGLVVAFLALYSWLMRRDLRFPNALLLFPIAIACCVAAQRVANCFVGELRAARLPADRAQRLPLAGRMDRVPVRGHRHHGRLEQNGVFQSAGGKRSPR